MLREQRTLPITADLVVKQVNIHDAKTNLSRYLAELTPGEPIALCNRNRPAAEIRFPSQDGQPQAADWDSQGKVRDPRFVFRSVARRSFESF